jgi:hypothetical protein
MTPRREVVSLKNENETLRAEMAGLAAQLESVKVSSKEEKSAPAPVTVPVPAAMPDFSLLDAQLPAKPARPASAFLFYSASSARRLASSGRR